MRSEKEQEKLFKPHADWSDGEERNHKLGFLFAMWVKEKEFFFTAKLSFYPSLMVTNWHFTKFNRVAKYSKFV